MPTSQAPNLRTFQVIPVTSSQDTDTLIGDKIVDTGIDLPDHYNSHNPLHCPAMSLKRSSLPEYKLEAVASFTPHTHSHAFVLGCHDFRVFVQLSVLSVWIYLFWAFTGLPLSLSLFCLAHDILFVDRLNPACSHGDWWRVNINKCIH